MAEEKQVERTPQPFATRDVLAKIWQDVLEQPRLVEVKSELTASSLAVLDDGLSWLVDEGFLMVYESSSSIDRAQDLFALDPECLADLC